MGMLETKVLRVENSENVINVTSEERACFGWTVTNVQVTFDRNTRTYSSAWDQIGGNQSSTVETTTVEYATMTLQRDRDIRNYQEIVELERKYESILASLSRAMAEKNKAEDIGCLSMIIWPIALYKMFINPKGKQLEGEIERLRTQKASLLEQAASLLR